MSEYRSPSPRPSRSWPPKPPKQQEPEPSPNRVKKLTAVAARFFSPLCCLVLCMVAGLVTGAWMEGASAEGSSFDRLAAMLARRGMAIREPVDNRLGRLQSIEVETLNPKLSSDNPPPEIIEAVRTALQNDSRLPYKSPGDAVLRLRCVDKSCNDLDAEVVIGCTSDPAVLWHMTLPHRASSMEFIPDAHKTANRIVKQLTEDYIKAMQPASRDRIDILEKNSG